MINSSPEGLYRNNYNLMWTVRSIEPLSEVRLLYRLMVGKLFAILSVSNFDMCQMSLYAGPSDVVSPILGNGCRFKREWRWSDQRNVEQPSAPVEPLPFQRGRAPSPSGAYPAHVAGRHGG